MIKVVLTGASRGIGKATAIRLAKLGAQLALIGQDSDSLKETLQALEGTAPKPICIECDLRDHQSCIDAASTALDQMGTPDAIIHNAGAIFRQSVEDTTLEHWEAQMAINARAPFLITREMLPALREAGAGRIVHVASISATLGTAGSAAYNASKWAVVGWMKSLAEELRDSGLMTCAILPGSVGTRMLEGSGFEARMTPDEVAQSILHYALDAPIAHNGGVIEMFGV